MPSWLDRRAVLQAPNPGRRTFDGLKRLARVVKIYDGDTINVVTRRCKGEKHFEYPVRIAGIDTPEIRPSLTMPNRDLHKQAAETARDWLAKLIPVGSVVLIDFGAEEKFGRLLGTVHTMRKPWGRPWVWVKHVNVGERLLQEGMGREYSGGTKAEWGEEHLRRIVGTA